MKLIIDNELETYIKDPDINVELYKEVLSKYNVLSNIVETDNYVLVEIPVQKIVLDEIQMNELFADVLCDFPHELRYAWLGGAGCDFAIKLEWRYFS